MSPRGCVLPLAIIEVHGPSTVTILESPSTHNIDAGRSRILTTGVAPHSPWTMSTRRSLRLAGHQRRALRFFGFLFVSPGCYHRLYCPIAMAATTSNISLFATGRSCGLALCAGVIMKAPLTTGVTSSPTGLPPLRLHCRTVIPHHLFQ